jgi:hypothetical protein
MFDWIHAVPLVVAKIGAALIFGSIVVLSWLMPKDFIYHGAPDRALWRDLRIWATILLLLQGLLYYIF